MHFQSTFAAIAGAALFSVAEAAVCRPKHPGQYGSSGYNAGPQPQAGNQGGWNNWDGSPVVIRTTTMPYNNQMNPQATNGPNWGGWNGGANPAPAPVPTYAAQPPAWNQWYPVSSGNPIPASTTTATNSLTDNPIGVSTTTTLVTIPTATTTTSTSAVVSPGSLTTSSTTVTTTTTDTTTTTTTTTTTSTPTSTNPACPAGTFVLRATNAENASLEGLYAGLANNGQGNLVAFSEDSTATAVQVAFDANCQLVSAVGPLLVIDNAGEFSPIHYQYMNDPATLAAGLISQNDVCAIDANNVLSCTVGGQTVLQTVDDVLSIGDQLYYQTVTVVLEQLV